MTQIRYARILYEWNNLPTQKPVFTPKISISLLMIERFIAWENSPRTPRTTCGLFTFPMRILVLSKWRSKTPSCKNNLRSTNTVQHIQSNAHDDPMNVQFCVIESDQSHSYVFTISFHVSRIKFPPGSNGISTSIHWLKIKFWLSNGKLSCSTSLMFALKSVNIPTFQWDCRTCSA